MGMTTPNPPENYTKFIVLGVYTNMSINGSVYETLYYNCSLNASDVAPFSLENNTWKPINISSITAGSCYVGFHVARRSITALMFKTTVPKPPLKIIPKTTNNNAYIIFGILVITLLALLALWKYFKTKS